SRLTVAADRPGTVLANDSYSFPLSGSKVIKLRNSMMCDSYSPCPGTDPSGNYGDEEYWKGALVHLVDPSLPAFDSIGGEGWKAEPADGKDEITYNASDTGSGVYEVKYYLDGVLQSTQTASCAAEALMPCPAST